MVDVFDFTSFINTQVLANKKLTIVDKLKPHTISIENIKDFMDYNKDKKTSDKYPLTLNKDGVVIPFLIELGSINQPKYGRLKICRFTNPNKKSEFQSAKTLSKKMDNDIMFKELSSEDRLIVKMEINMDSYIDIINVLENSIQKIGDIQKELFQQEFEIKGKTIKRTYISINLTEERNYKWNPMENKLVIKGFNRFGKAQSIEYDIPKIKWRERDSMMKTFKINENIHPIININKFVYKEDFFTKQMGWEVDMYLNKLYISE